VDLESFFRSEIENMLITASWVEEVKRLLQITGISQVWRDGPPAWYFWIDSAPGVHELRLEDTFTRDSKGRELSTGLFAVKFYPFPDNEIFNRFSFEEQTFVQSPFFDKSNTPTFENYTEIPDVLFKVAILELTVDTQNNQTLFKLESLDRIRTRFKKETVLECKPFNKRRRFHKGGTDRDVPGWDLGYSLYDRILGLYANYSKTRPYRIVMTRETGFEFIYDGNNSLQSYTTGDTELNALAVVFTGGAKRDQMQSDELIPEETKDVNKKVIFDRCFQCGHPHELNSQSLSNLPLLNDQWWKIAEADYKSKLTSLCGCT
jgi:hypothetical protein